MYFVSLYFRFTVSLSLGRLTQRDDGSQFSPLAFVNVSY
jgi:hypothetical protein